MKNETKELMTGKMFYYFVACTTLLCLGVTGGLGLCVLGGVIGFESMISGRAVAGMSVLRLRWRVSAGL